ncbi:MAG: hypothetical protein WA138_12350 [Parvibaculum sp.]
MLRNAEADVPNVATSTKAVNAAQEIPRSPIDGEEDAAGYLFEMLVAARRLAVARHHRFLAYLIGMAVEEARLLDQGRSALGR